MNSGLVMCPFNYVHTHFVGFEKGECKPCRENDLASMEIIHGLDTKWQTYNMQYMLITFQQEGLGGGGKFIGLNGS